MLIARRALCHGLEMEVLNLVHLIGAPRRLTPCRRPPHRARLDWLNRGRTFAETNGLCLYLLLRSEGYNRQARRPVTFASRAAKFAMPAVSCLSHLSDRLYRQRASASVMQHNNMFRLVDGAEYLTARYYRNHA